LNHHKKKKAEPFPLIPQKLTENLEVLVVCFSFPAKSTESEQIELRKLHWSIHNLETRVGSSQ